MPSPFAEVLHVFRTRHSPSKDSASILQPTNRTVKSCELPVLQPSNHARQMVRLHAHSATTRPREPWSTPVTCWTTDVVAFVADWLRIAFPLEKEPKKLASICRLSTVKSIRQEAFLLDGCLSVCRWQLYLNMWNIRNMYDRYVEMKHALCDNCSAQIFLNGPVVAPVTLMNDFLVYRQAMVCQAASLCVCLFQISSWWHCREVTPS